MLTLLRQTACICTVVMISLMASQAHAADVTLLQNGEAKFAIFVPDTLMAPDTKVAATATWAEKQAEKHRQTLRDTVNDFVRIVDGMSGSSIAIHQRPFAADSDKVIPMYFGSYAEKAFGKPAGNAEFGQGYRIVISPKGVGFIGQTDESASYAAYTFLDQLGCRWFIPGELGQSTPYTPDLTLPESDVSGQPSTAYRGVWYADKDFKRRNRMGGFLLSAGHALQGMISKEDLTAHPEWNAERNGERKIASGFLCWGNPEVAAAVSKTVIERLDKSYTPSVSLSPNDGMGFCQCEKFCKPLDAGDFDPTVGLTSITDRYIVFCNRIAEQVGKKYPEVVFGFLAYVHYTRPPVREKPHPNLIPQIAPITYCRAHAMTSDDCPSRPLMKPIVEGWTNSAKRVSYYQYMFHLAEVAVPYPMLRQMSAELPVIYGGTAKMLWQPETMANYESVAPAQWLTIRMAWDSSQNPETVLDEYFHKFHASAGPAMKRYWTVIDNAWMDVPEHAGCGWGYAARFTPQVMAEARSAMNDALAPNHTVTTYRRVQLFDASFRQFERFMQMRWDLAQGRLGKLSVQNIEYLGTLLGLSKEYADNYTYSAAGWSSWGSIAAGYYKAFFFKTYEDTGRFAGRGAPYTFLDVTSNPLRKWQYTFIERTSDPEKKAGQDATIKAGEDKQYHTVDFDDAAWKSTDSAVETWASLGLLGKYGTMWYRAKVNMPKIPDGKKVYLWIAATDGSAKVYVNGKHVPYVTKDGKTEDVANGYAQPFEFDVTSAVKAGEINHIAIAGTRLFINELGTGGLLGPVYMYRDK